MSIRCQGTSVVGLPVCDTSYAKPWEKSNGVTSLMRNRERTNQQKPTRPTNTHLVATKAVKNSASGKQKDLRNFTALKETQTGC